jgi:hypothetical protein
MSFDVKKIIQRIYEFDLSNTSLVDGEEILSDDSHGGNEFLNNFTRRDLDRGIIVTPRGYRNGLVYKSSNNGEVYNNPTWVPDIVSFALNLYGLKKDHFYRVTVVGRNVHKYNRVTDITENRYVEVLTKDKERIIYADLSEKLSNVESEGIFRASSVEENLFFSIGKVYISNIIIDEIEILPENEEERLPEADELVIQSGKTNLVGYGIFSCALPDFASGSSAELEKLSGKGINIYLNKDTKIYTIERDNVNDCIGLPLSDISIFYDINDEKCPGVHHSIVDVSERISPHTIKPGYISFKLLNDKDNEATLYNNGFARIYVFINKLN